MSKIKNIVVGAGIGLGVGCVVSVVRTIGALSPLAWPAAMAVAAGGTAFHICKSESESPEVTVAATTVSCIAGFGAGVVCVPCAPILTPVMLAEAACLPVVGMVSGAIIGGLNK